MNKQKKNNLKVIVQRWSVHKIIKFVKVCHNIVKIKPTGMFALQNM